MKQTKAVYATANTIIRRFSSASLSTKLLLLKAKSALQYMSVSFAFSTRIVNLMLHIMMLSDNCYKNLDGVAHHSFLCLTSLCG